MRGINACLRLLSLLLIVALAVLLASNLYVIAARALTGALQPTVLGYSSAVVVTGSMSPAIEAGDFILCRRAAAYQVGDVVCFVSESGSSVITHRIVDACEAGFVTRGDANNAPDSAYLTQDRIIGRVIGALPGFGRFLEALRSPLGLCILVLTGFALYELPRWVEHLQRREKGGSNDGTHSR